MTEEMRKSPTFNLKQRESIKRLLYVVANYSAAMDGYSASTKMVAVAVPWKIAMQAFTIVSAIVFGVSLACLVVAQFFKFLIK